MIAMRVVNNVEKEMVRAEWENWLLDENTRCKQVKMMLRENRTSSSPSKKMKRAGSQQVIDDTERDRDRKLEELRKWQEEYCGSCQREQDLLERERKHITYG
jgi:hypothetical protein